MNKTDTATREPLDQLGQQLAGLLTQATGELSHDLSERLRVARQQALAAQKPAPVLLHHTVQNGSTLALTDPSSEGPGLWRILGSIVPLLALAAGLVTVQWLDREQFVSDLAEIDTALLVDDLPPSAYSDPGFIQFLRQAADDHRPQD